jgi:hypothetical protein
MTAASAICEPFGKHRKTTGSATVDQLFGGPLAVACPEVTGSHRKRRSTMSDGFDQSERLGLGEFCDQLQQLRLECGNPPLKAFEQVTPVKRTQLSALFNGKINKPPAWDLVRKVVEVCRRTAPDEGLNTSLPLTDSYWWNQLQRTIQTFAHPEPDAWADLARKHRAWEYADDSNSLRLEVEALAQRLADRRASSEQRLAADPWHDSGLPGRMLAYAEDLLQHCAANGTFRLSPTEAALVVLTPMLYHVVSLETVAEFVDIDPANLEQTAAPSGSPRSEYERFLASNPHQRLVSRTRLPPIEGRESKPDEIGWWLYHRWLAGRAPRVDANPVEGLIEDGRLHRVLAGPLAHLIRLFRLPPSDLRNPTRDHLGSVRGSVVRERLVGLLLVTAHAMAIELATLSSTVVEHLGIPEPVKIDDLRRTLEHCDWTVESSGIVLDARCGHEAVLEALEKHCDHTDDVLRAVRSVAARETAVQALQALPAGASASEVRPGEIAGKPLFVVPPARFTLDETRVRELLMGEQLYRDRSLAIRELYQNALDACRYRKARHEYRRRTGQPDGDWRGRIEFEQGVDADGRAYLLCRDNGVGMGRTELSEVFSQAGVRFADRLEFAEERAEWAEQGVFLHPNSRFGIGVMSYFMLADEIEVTTCRMSRSERLPGPALRVFIAGPGHLFRINEVAPHGVKPGTSVKLFLRAGEDMPSCVRTLRALLGIAEFETVAEHDGSVAEWHPNDFQPRERQEWEEDGINAFGQLAAASPGPNGQVVWCQFGGALLVDGIYVHASHQRKILRAVEGSEDPRGAVINIVGAQAPALTVDRISVFEDVSNVAEELLGEAGDVLRSDASAFASYSWIIDVAETSPGIADLITDELSHGDVELALSDRVLLIKASGVMAIDSELCGAHHPSRDESGNSIRKWKIPDHILLWRLLALVDEPLGSWSEVLTRQAGKLLPARPSDTLILKNLADYAHHSLDSKLPPGPLLKTCSDLGVEPDVMFERMQLLNLPRPQPITEPASRYSPIDLALLSKKIDGRQPWVPVGQVDTSHLIVASVRLKVPIARIAQRMRELGYITPNAAELPKRVEDSDLRLLSYNLDGKPPWSEFKFGIGFHRIVQFAIASQQEVEQVLRRAQELGIPVRQRKDTLISIFELDQKVAQIFSELRMTGESTTRAELLYRAARRAISPRKTAEMLTKLGFEIQEASVIPAHLDRTDVAILDSIPSFTANISLALLIDIENKTSLARAEVLSRLAKLGFNTSAQIECASDLDSTDRQLIDHLTEFSSYGEISRIAITYAALKAECSPWEAGARLHRIGVPIENYDDLPTTKSNIDLAAISKSQSRFDLIPEGSLVPTAHIIQRAHQHRLPPQDMARRINSLGYRTASEDQIPTVILDSDLALLSWPDATMTTRWQDPFEPVSVANLIRAAIRCRISITAAADRMRKLGCRVPDLKSVLPPLLARVPMMPGDERP